MRRRRFGPLDVELPVIGLGTWQMERDDRAQAIAAIQRALELGLTHVDTAEMYGSGTVESLVGEAIRGRRERVFLVSKVLPSHASHAGTIQACEASLRRLGTDHLDCYLLHWRESEPLEHTFGAFEELRAAGKIRSWGVSNFDEQDLEDAYALVGPDKIACNQVLYHLGNRSIEHRLVPWCTEHRIAVTAYSPFGSRGGFPKSKVLDKIADQHGVTARQVALAFLLRWPSVFAIPKSSAAAHVDQLAHEVVLDDAALAAVDKAFPLGPWHGLPTL